jgi:hypothetical protein
VQWSQLTASTHAIHQGLVARKQVFSNNTFPVSSSSSDLIIEELSESQCIFFLTKMLPPIIAIQGLLDIKSLDWTQRLSLGFRDSLELGLIGAEIVS